MLKTVLDCKQHCQKWQDRGCVAYVYEQAESKCTLYNSIEHIEYDEETGTGYESGSKVFGVPGLVTDKLLFCSYRYIYDNLTIKNGVLAVSVLDGITVREKYLK